MFEKSNILYQQDTVCGPVLNSGCFPIANDTIITVVIPCTNYCTNVDSNEYGLIHTEKSNSKSVSLFNVDNMVLTSNAILTTGNKELYMELKSDKLEIVPESGLESMSIISINGSKVYFNQAISNKNSVQIPVHILQNGMYSLVFETKNGIKSVPLIISR